MSLWIMMADIIAETFKQYGGATQPFTLNNIKTYARITSIYDGDTMHAVIPVLGSYFKFSIRMYGIDTCEIKSKISVNKDAAFRARNRVIELVTKKPFNEDVMKTKKQIEAMLEKDVYIVWLHCLEMDKYGRVLAKVYASDKEEQTFSDILINEKLGYAYFGDTKKTEAEQI